jgi:hypothetical protein
MIALPLAICLHAQASHMADQPGAIPPVSTPWLPAEATSAARFAPQGWQVERHLTGDLNKDGRPDLVVVLKGADPACRVTTELASEPLDTNPRLLVVAFRTARGYTRRVASAAVIPRRNDPFADDPLEIGGLSIRNGVLCLRLGHWRSLGGWGTYSNKLSLRWDGAAFRLIGFDRDHLQRNSGETETLSVNFLTGKARIATGSMQDDVEEKVLWKAVPRQATANLETFGDGLEYEPKL